MNNLYTQNDLKMFDQHVDRIIKESDELRLANVEPTKDRMWEIIFTVRDFVIEKKRKIYGGFALNKMIEEVSPQDRFYDDDNIEAWDIDFYSPDPINDAVEIANRLHAKGFKYVLVNEAQHDETYKVFAETIDCADISYVPKNIYNRMPYKEYQKLYLTGPHFMMIDYFRVMTDPMNSYFRIEKTFKRLSLMQKIFPLPHSKSPIEIDSPPRNMDIAFNLVHDFLSDRKSCIVVGMYAYNHLIAESKINERKSDRKTTPINFLDINYYEVISTNYIADTKNIINSLYEKFSTPEMKKMITYKEFYPFFQYLGYSTDIYFERELILRIYHYNNRCTPYCVVPALYFRKGEYDASKKKIMIGSFSQQVMYALINITRARTNNDNNTKNVYYTMLSHIIEMRNYFFATQKKTIYDNSMFQEFVMRCTGYTESLQMEKALRIERKKKLGKMYSFRYVPATDIGKNLGRHMFKNSSGNEIQNPKNIKIDLKKTVDAMDTENEEEEGVNE